MEKSRLRKPVTILQTAPEASIEVISTLTGQPVRYLRGIGRYSKSYTLCLAYMSRFSTGSIEDLSPRYWLNYRRRELSLVEPRWWYRVHSPCLELVGDKRHPYLAHSISERWQTNTRPSFPTASCTKSWPCVLWQLWSCEDKNKTVGTWMGGEFTFAAKPELCFWSSRGDWKAEPWHSREDGREYYAVGAGRYLGIKLFQPQTGADWESYFLAYQAALTGAGGTIGRVVCDWLEKTPQAQRVLKVCTTTVPALDFCTWVWPTPNPTAPFCLSCRLINHA